MYILGKINYILSKYYADMLCLYKIAIENHCTKLTIDDYDRELNYIHIIIYN